MTGAAPTGKPFPAFAAARRLAQALSRLGHALERRTPRFVKRIGTVTWELLDFTSDD